jgi:hypothetical protein
MWAGLNRPKVLGFFQYGNQLWVYYIISWSHELLDRWPRTRKLEVRCLVCKDGLESEYSFYLVKTVSLCLYISVLTVIFRCNKTGSQIQNSNMRFIELFLHSFLSVWCGRHCRIYLTNLGEFHSRFRIHAGAGPLTSLSTKCAFPYKVTTVKIGTNPKPENTLDAKPWIFVCS